VLRRLGGTPGVSSVSVLEFFNNDAFYPVGQPTKAGRTILDHQDIAVGQGFLKTLGVPLLRGRDLSEADYASAAPIALVSSATAETFWPGEDPLGKQIVVPPARRRGDTTRVEPLTVTVVGVVGNLRLGRVLGPPPMSLLRANGAKAGMTNYYVRTAKDPEQTLPAILRELHALQEIPISRTMYGNLQKIGINRQLAEQRVTTSALIAFAAVALLLATIGIHGLVSYSVAQRTREIGIRMALGAEARSVLLLVTQRGLRLAAIGIVLGVGGAFALSQAIRAMLYGTSPTDPIVFIGSALLLATIVLIASYLPARRATRVDPMIALRVD
jgi:putative ABC transport system permease protein